MAGMKIALLGATGFVGRQAATVLAGRPEVNTLVLVDYDIRNAKKMAKALSPRCCWAMADVGRPPELERLLGDVDVVASAVGPCAEYEKTVLLTCARMETPAASIGDGPLSEEDRRVIHDAFRHAGTAAVSGCGLMPGWTEILAAHFLPSRVDPYAAGVGGISAGEPEISARVADAKATRFLFWSPARFGGYAFFRRAVFDTGKAVPAPPGAPAGTFLETGAGGLIGLSPGLPAAFFLRLKGALSPLGAVGRELSAAFLFWLRDRMAAEPGMPAAVVGVAAGGSGSIRAAHVTDPEGGLPALLLAETALRLVRAQGREKGLLPLAGLIGRQEAERIAAEGGGRIGKGPA
jgi:hypothetical protein